jgi:DNA-binding MarR family transcriptional regulator/GNAT superfamily N-acetyltransferase
MTQSAGLSPKEATEAVLAVREFSRFYTGVIGLLGGYRLAAPYSLTEARVLYELGQADTTDTFDLRTRLALDPGYLSRIVAKFDAAGLVVSERSAVDGRRQVLRLTDAGREVQQDLDARSSEQVAGLLAGTVGTDRRALVDALATARTILSRTSATPRGPVSLRPPRPGDLGWVVQRHGARYAEEYGFDVTFEGLVAQIVGDFGRAADDPGSATYQAAWIAELDGEPVGSIFCTRKDEKVAQLRLLLVEPAARGAGVGTALVDECIRFAKAAGYRELMLWTNDILHAARRVYQRAGFTLEYEGPKANFGTDLVEQVWRRPL